jgi:broad specificity phosphatase PhoE
MNETTTRFWWVRHAPVPHGGRIYGQLDLSCDCSDSSLFIRLAKQLPSSAIWVTTNLRRTHETAAAIIRAGLPGPRAIPGPDALALADLAEQNFGEWQGLTYEELSQSRNGDFHRFWHAPAHEAPPGGESFLAVAARVSRAIHRLAETYAGSDIIAVAHAARSARHWGWRSASIPRRPWRFRSTTARSPASTGSRAPVWVTAGGW